MQALLQNKLADGLLEMGLQIDTEKQVKLIAYLLLIDKWNTVHNLTAIRNPIEMVTLHLLDSLSVLSHMQAIAPEYLLDVGSGAGLPSIPLAICLPELQVTAIDSVSKKTTFMRQVKGELGLSNFQVEARRVEALKRDRKFDVIISRAFSEIGLFVKLTKHLLAENGQWLAMKGVLPTHEFESQDFKSAGIRLSKIEVLKVAGLDAERHLVFLSQSVL